MQLTTYYFTWLLKCWKMGVFAIELKSQLLGETSFLAFDGSTISFLPLA